MAIRGRALEIEEGEGYPWFNGNSEGQGKRNGDGSGARILEPAAHRERISQEGHYQVTEASLEKGREDIVKLRADIEAGTKKIVVYEKVDSRTISREITTGQAFDDLLFKESVRVLPNINGHILDEKSVRVVNFPDMKIGSVYVRTPGEDGRFTLAHMIGIEPGTSRILELEREDEDEQRKRRLEKRIVENAGNEQQREERTWDLPPVPKPPESNGNSGTEMELPPLPKVHGEPPPPPASNGNGAHDTQPILPYTEHAYPETVHTNGNGVGNPNGYHNQADFASAAPPEIPVPMTEAALMAQIEEMLRAPLDQDVLLQSVEDRQVFNAVKQWLRRESTDARDKVPGADKWREFVTVVLRQRIAKAYDVLVTSIPAEPGTDDEVYKFGVLDTIYDEMAAWIRSAVSPEDKLAFWGLTGGVLEKVFPAVVGTSTADRSAQIVGWLEHIGEERQLQNVMLDITNEVVANSMIEIIHRPLDQDEMKKLTAEGGNEETGKIDGNARKLLEHMIAGPNVAEALLARAGFRSNSYDTALFWKDLSDIVIQWLLPELLSPEGELINTAFVPTRRETEQIVQDAVQQDAAQYPEGISQAFDSLVRKYPRIPKNLSRSEQKGLLLRAMSVVESRIRKVGGEASKVISLADSMLKEKTGRTLFYRGERARHT